MSQEENCRRGRERTALCGLPWVEVKKAQSATTSTQLLLKQVFLDRFRIHFPSEKQVELWGRHLEEKHLLASGWHRSQQGFAFQGQRC